MNKKRFNKHFDEIGRRSRVKMHKSGKNWVRTVLSQISLLRVIRGKGQAKVTLPIIETNEEQRSSRLAYLQALLASGAAISGTTLALNTFAEEQVAVVEQQVDSTDTLVDKNIVVVESVLTEVVSEESVASDTGSATASEEGSGSASTSGSFSASQSASVSLSSSESASLSVSVSASTSASVSVSTSASESASTSVSMSVSSSLVEGKTSLIGAVGSENSSEPSGSETSEFSLVAVENQGGLSHVPSTDLLAPTDAFAQPDSTIVAMATASSEVATGLVATSLNSSSSSQSETAQMANSLDYTNLDNAIASLQHALSYPEVDATTTTASRYKRYETALKVAKAALEESLALREDSSLGQDKVDTMALIAGQAAISLTGRINQIKAAGGMLRTAVGSGFRTNIVSMSDSSGAVRGISGDYNESDGTITWTINLTIGSGFLGFYYSLDADQTLISEPSINASNVTFSNARVDTRALGATLDTGDRVTGRSLKTNSRLSAGNYQITLVTRTTNVSDARLFASAGVHARNSTTQTGTASVSSAVIPKFDNPTGTAAGGEHSVTAVDRMITYARDVRDITRPVAQSVNDILLFNGFEIGTPLVFATIKEASAPSTWQRYGISYYGDSSTVAQITGQDIQNELPGITISAQRVSGSSDTNQILVSGTPVFGGNINNDTFFTRSPYVFDAAGNRMVVSKTGGGWHEAKFVVVGVSDTFVNMSWGERATADFISNRGLSQLVASQDSRVRSIVERIRLSVTGALPAVNESKAVQVTFSVSGQTNTANTTVYVNYPPSFSNVSQNVYVFSGVPTTVNKQVATITETDGQTFTTQTTNAAGLTVNTSGVISTGQTFTGAVGSQTVTLRATDNYNNSNSTTFVVRSYNVTGGQPMTAEVGTKVTTEAILNHVKATATGGGTTGLTGSGLDNISSYRILSGFDEHQPTLGQKTVRVRVTLTDGNYKDVDVFINYQDTIAPTVQLTSQQIYVFNGESVKILNPASPTADNPVSTKIQLATVTDATGVATTASSNGDVQNSSGSSNSRGMDVTVEGSSATSKTVYLSGTPTVGNLPNNGGPAYGWYGNYLKISDTANPANTTTYNSTDARYHLVVLGTSVATIADRDIQSPTFTRVTEQNILDAVSVDFGNASDYNNANKANIRKVLLSNTDTGTVTAGQKTAVVRVYTSTNTYKDVPVTFTYRDMTAPTATLTATSLYAFEGQALRAPIQLATLADAPNGSGLTGGQATTQIVMASSTTENGKGLTINSSGQVSGTPIAGSQGSYTNRVLVRDNAGNTGYSNSFKMYVLRANPVTATREYTGNNKFTTAEITDLIKNQIAADSRISVADLSALTYTIPDHTYAVGSQTIQATVRTPAGDTKTVPVTLNYTDTTNPTITNRKDVTIFIGKQIEMVGNSTLIPVTATDVSGVRYNLNSATFGVTVDSATGQLQGTATGSPGFNTRTVTVTDGQGRTTTSEGFRIYLIQATPTTVTREYGQTISADEIKNAITLNRGTNGSPVAVNMELLDPIPQNTDGTVRVRLTTAENVTTVVDIPVVYTNERPTIQASNQTITKNREGTPTMYDVTTGVTVRDREDDRSASDSLVTRKRYEIVNANNVVVKTVAEGAATNIDIRDLPAGNYTVKIYATDSGATNPVEGSYTLTVNADTQAPTILSSQNVSVFSGRLIEMVSGRTL
ncbi:TPA: accessory Sec-dependent serine-rich glycoprotein adhesin, partial [Streptococcus suis]|nr:accessory Sec-dependent serine-rich glycoprotein adhesin [Streptococcus suis]